jgi:two-component system sensor kinase FixL
VKNELLQVIMNLMINAIQAMNSTPPESRLMHVQTIRDDGVVILSVRDSGEGISQDIMDNLFEPFQTTKSYGLGMGLSISRRVIEKNGGKIWADSNEKDGSTFSFTLPLATKTQGGDHG